MGKVNYYIHKNEKVYFNNSLSSEEEVYEILWKFDYIAGDAEKGNNDAILLMVEFEELLKKLKNKDSLKVIKKYIDIKKNGIECNKQTLQDNNISFVNFLQDEIELLAHTLNISYDECKNKLHEAVLNIVDINNKYIDENEYMSNTRKVKSRLTELNKNIDTHSLSLKKKNFPEDLRNLVKLLNYNKAILKEISNKKNKSEEDKKEVNKRIKLSKELQEDIKLLKEHYNIAHIEKNKMICREHENIDFVLPAELEKSMEKIEEEQSIELEQRWKVEKINFIANKILTEKQLIIFNLYYLNCLTQNEISQIIGTSREYVKNEILKINNKIKNNF